VAFRKIVLNGSFDAGLEKPIVFKTKNRFLKFIVFKVFRF